MCCTHKIRMLALIGCGEGVVSICQHTQLGTRLGTPKLEIFLSLGEFITYFVRLYLFHANVLLLLRQFQRTGCITC